MKSAIAECALLLMAVAVWAEPAFARSYLNCNVPLMGALGRVLRLGRVLTICKVRGAPDPQPPRPQSGRQAS